LPVWAGKIGFTIKRKIMAQQEDNGINVGDVVKLKSGEPKNDHGG
jgi:ribosomal protein S17